MTNIRPIKGSPGYFISDQGEAFGPRGKMKGSVLKGQGYIYVTVGGRRAKVHTLVLEAFVGPRPPGLITLHANDIRSDNRLENLSWGTSQQNVRDCVTRRRHSEARKTHCVHGHEFTPENTSVLPRGERRCRGCHRRRALERLRRAGVPERTSSIAGAR